MYSICWFKIKHLFSKHQKYFLTFRKPTTKFLNTVYIPTTSLANNVIFATSGGEIAMHILSSVANLARTCRGGSCPLYSSSSPLPPKNLFIAYAISRCPIAEELCFFPASSGGRTSGCWRGCELGEGRVDWGGVRGVRSGRWRGCR